MFVSSFTYAISQDVLFGGLHTPLYKHVPDHTIVNNHAILMFNKFRQTILLMADIDEFFVPQASYVHNFYWVFSMIACHEPHSTAGTSK